MDIQKQIERVIAELDDWQYFYLMSLEDEAAGAIRQAQDKLKEVLTNGTSDTRNPPEPE